MSKRFIAALDLPDVVVQSWPGGARGYLEGSMPEVMHHMIVSVVPVEDDYEVVPKLELRALVRMALRELEIEPGGPVDRGHYDDQDRGTVHHWARGVLDPDEYDELRSDEGS